MRENRPQYEARAWTLTMEVIGQKLRERCRQPNDLSPRLLALVKKLDEKYFGRNKQGGLTAVLLAGRGNCSRYSGRLEMSGKHSTEARRRYQHAMNVPSSTCSHYFRHLRRSP